MDEKTTGIVSYIGPIGLIIAILMDKEKSPFTRFHIRQSLGICLTWIAIYAIVIIFSNIIGFVGMFLSFAYVIPLIMWIMGLIGAAKGEMNLVPVLGEKFQEWFKSV